MASQSEQKKRIAWGERLALLKPTMEIMRVYGRLAEGGVDWDSAVFDEQLAQLKEHEMKIRQIGDLEENSRKLAWGFSELWRYVDYDAELLGTLTMNGLLEEWGGVMGRIGLIDVADLLAGLVGKGKTETNLETSGLLTDDELAFCGELESVLLTKIKAGYIRIGPWEKLTARKEAVKQMAFLGDCRYSPRKLLAGAILDLVVLDALTRAGSETGEKLLTRLKATAADLDDIVDYQELIKGKAALDQEYLWSRGDV